MRFQQAPYRIADVVALLFILHGNTSFGSLAPIIPYRSCKHYLEKMYSQAIIEFHVYIGAFHEDLIVIEQFQIYYKDGIFM